MQLRFHQDRPHTDGLSTTRGCWSCLAFTRGVGFDASRDMVFQSCCRLLVKGNVHSRVGDRPTPTLSHINSLLGSKSVP